MFVVLNKNGVPLYAIRASINGAYKLCLDVMRRERTHKPTLVIL